MGKPRPGRAKVERGPSQASNNVRAITLTPFTAQSYNRLCDLQEPLAIGSIDVAHSILACRGRRARHLRDCGAGPRRPLQPCVDASRHHRSDAGEGALLRLQDDHEALCVRAGRHGRAALRPMQFPHRLLVHGDDLLRPSVAQLGELLPEHPRAPAAGSAAADPAAGPWAGPLIAAQAACPRSPAGSARAPMRPGRRPHGPHRSPAAVSHSRAASSWRRRCRGR